jgi:hypothetical protein
MASADNKGNGSICQVEGCNDATERSISHKKVAESDLTLKAGSHGQVGLCKNHYREFKKQTKKSRELDRIY